LLLTSITSKHCPRFNRSCSIWIRVARWHIFKPKIPIRVNFEGLAMEDIYFMVLWHIVWSFGVCISWLFCTVTPFCYVVPRKIRQPWPWYHVYVPKWLRIPLEGWPPPPQKKANID
jgi:hypothetical protein